MNTAGLYNTVGPIYPLYKTIFIKICWLTFSSLLCNFTVLLYFVPFLPFSTLTSSLSITSVSLSLSLLFPPLPLPLTPPHLPRLYNIRITAAGAAASSLLPPPSSLPSPRSASQPIECHYWQKYGGGQASHGIIQLTYPETSSHSVWVCFLHVCH